MSAKVRTLSLAAQQTLKELQARGVVLEPPPQVNPEAIEIDLRCYRRQPCGTCGERNPHIIPSTRQGRYVLVSVCGYCGSPAER